MLPWIAVGLVPSPRQTKEAPRQQGCAGRQPCGRRGARRAPGGVPGIDNTGVIKISGRDRGRRPRNFQKGGWSGADVGVRRLLLRSHLPPGFGSRRPQGRRDWCLRRPNLRSRTNPWRKLLGFATGVCFRPGKLSAQNKNFERAPKSTTTRGQPEGEPRGTGPRAARTSLADRVANPAGETRQARAKGGAPKRRRPAVARGGK